MRESTKREKKSDTKQIREHQKKRREKTAATTAAARTN